MAFWLVETRLHDDLAEMIYVKCSKASFFSSHSSSANNSENPKEEMGA